MLHRLIEVNFSKLTDSNQIFRNDSVAFIITSVNFQFKLTSAKIFLPMISCNELYNTIYSVVLSTNTITRQRRITTTGVADAVVVPMKIACMRSK